ncbi:hypothetical protein [Prosthecobacter sp.]|uniref:hypothetical protein n=1 Tax=Prosthecobacter sp. TaxID=1965333 RepID=UPI0037845EF2
MKSDGLLDELDVAVICRPSKGMGKIPNAPSTVVDDFSVADVVACCEESREISKNKTLIKA